MVLGQFSCRVNSKGRIAMPKKLRGELGNTLVVTQGYEQSLIIVAQHSWEELITGTGDKPFIVGSARDTNRFLLGGASIVELDNQGRFVVPQYLRKYAEIGDEIVFLGLGRYVEVWDSTKWNKYRGYLNKNIASIAKELSQLNVEGRKQ